MTYQKRKWLKHPELLTISCLQFLIHLAWRFGQKDLNIKIGKHGYLSDFKHGIVVSARRAGLSFSFLRFFPTASSRVYIEWPEKENIQ